MSTEAKKKKAAGTFFLPLAVAVPIAAGMILVLNRVWPAIHKLVSILIKLVVKA